MVNLIHLTTESQQVYLMDDRGDKLVCSIIKDLGVDYEAKLLNGVRLVVSKKDYRAYRRIV